MDRIRSAALWIALRSPWEWLSRALMPFALNAQRIQRLEDAPRKMRTKADG